MNRDRTAPLSSSSSYSTADTRGARQRHDYKQDVYESTDRKIVWTLVPRVWQLPPYFFIRPCACAVCAYDAAACCAMLTCASKKRRLDCWRAAIFPPLFRATTTMFLDAPVDCRLQRRHRGLSRLLCVFHGIGTALW
ncbi:hypothetical protein TcCL_Unassigned00571 [Trypanosoma cruzi]|nr:hypothetical protein TcCL_Unassigned00571 [Trypanosoma cruzi]